jgi:hypothetical protein
VVSTFVFDAFRGLSFRAYFVLCVGYVCASFTTARTPGLIITKIIKASEHRWFVADHQKPWVTPNFFGIVVYGLFAVLPLHPLIPHVLDWVFGEVLIDLKWIVTCVGVYIASVAFFGLLRTIQRLHTGKGLWQDDHILMHMLPAMFLLADGAIWAFFVKQLWIFDLNGLAFCGIAICAVATIALAFGTMASYGPSFMFVYVAIIKPHSKVEVA